MLLLRLLAKSSRGGGGLHRLICGQKKVEWLPFPLGHTLEQPSSLPPLLQAKDSSQLSSGPLPWPPSDLPIFLTLSVDSVPKLGIQPAAEELVQPVSARLSLYLSPVLCLQPRLFPASCIYFFLLQHP